uniref:Uncharacterized protein n=1 Tax=Arundo donax TaxID=35708 RepID=A0A0A9HF17_ARUDO
MPDNHSETIVTVAEDSDPCHTTVDARAINAGEDSSTATIVRSDYKKIR